MKPKPGRKSSADLHPIPIGSRDRRLQPPDDLGPSAAALFRKLVASCPPTHFCAADAPLLGVYCSALIISQRSASDPSQFQAWERSTRLVAQLCSKLRLSPSSRSDPKSVARASLDHAPSYYDLARTDE